MEADQIPSDAMREPTRLRLTTRNMSKFVVYAQAQRSGADWCEVRDLCRATCRGIGKSQLIEHIGGVNP